MLNEVKLIGRLGKKPEIKDTNGGKKVSSFSVATWYNHKKQDGEWETVSEWHRVNVWGDACQRLEKMDKGDLVLVSGELRTRKYTDKDSIERYVTEITGVVKLLSKSEHLSPKQEEQATNQETDYTSEGENSDLPF